MGSDLTTSVCVNAVDYSQLSPLFTSMWIRRKVWAHIDGPLKVVWVLFIFCFSPHNFTFQHHGSLFYSPLSFRSFPSELAGVSISELAMTVQAKMSVEESQAVWALLGSPSSRAWWGGSLLTTKTWTAEVQTEQQHRLKKRKKMWLWMWFGCRFHWGWPEQFRNCWFTGIFTYCQL